MHSLQVRSLQLENFKTIKHLTLDLAGSNGMPTRLYVLTGPNGSGKTTVLEALLWAMGKESALDQRAAFPAGASVRAELADTYTGKGRLFVRQDDVPWDKEAVLEAHHFASGDRVPVLKRRLLDEHARDDDGGAFSRSRAWMGRLNTFWKRFSPDAETRLDFGSGDVGVFRGRERLSTLEELSDGEREVFQLAAGIVTEGVTDGVVLLDEPAPHLGAAWQASLIPALRELVPLAQLIIATHSEILWEQSQPWRRASLAPGGSKV